MYLKKLEIFGFKSFPHKLSLGFGSGTTGIVGPNGCGKTNIADAIRWVLGEQSAAELRGGSMADVIFNGTRQRRRLGMAEVSLTIDNSSGVLPTDYSEVVIARRVFRSGESEYLINKTPCRLRDVRDLFLDTGLGSRNYSLIERKMVDSVLSDSAVHRRFLFEEAAGIMKYKVRKHSALLKIQATEQDMQRVTDVISEVEKQVRSLKRQLSQANRHRTYTDALRELEIELGRWDYGRCSKEREAVADELSDLGTKLTAAADSLAAAERSVTRLHRERQDKEEALGSLELEVREVETRARDLAEGLLVAGERKSARMRRVAELDVELSDLNAALSRALERAARLEEEIGQAAAAVHEKETELESRMDETAGIEKEYSRLKEHLDGQKQTRLTGLTSAAELKAELESYRARLDDLRREHVELEAAIGQGRTALAEKESEILTALEDERKLMESAQSARGGAQEAAEELDATRDALLELTELRTKSEGQLEAARKKLNILREIRDGYDGFQEGVRSLLSGNSEVSDSLLGTVADIIDVDAEMTTAVETALAGAAQYVVTRDVEAARAAMNLLESRCNGRATFIPLSELSDVKAAEAPAEVLAHAGVLGAARRFVRCAREFEPVVDLLLEGALVVENLDSAIALSRHPDASGMVLVTPCGQMAAASGVLAGGRVGDQDAALLRRAERAENAERELALVGRRVSEITRREAALSENLAAQVRKAHMKKAAADHAEQQLWGSKRRTAQLELEKTNLSANVSRLAAQREALADKMALTRRDVEVLAERVTSISRGDDEIGERVDELERKFRRMEGALSTAREEGKALEIESAAARSALTQLRSELSQLSENAAAARASIRKKAAEREDHLSEAARLESRIERDAHTQNEIEREKRALTSNRDSMREATRALGREMEELEERSRGEREKKEELQKQIHARELKDTELRTRGGALRERIAEEYSVDIAEAAEGAEPKEPLDPTAARNEVERLKARLRSMGPVNLLALEEYDEESKRLEFLKEQYDDLERSKDSLREAIERINTTARDMFLETFEQARANFVDTFRRLFEGGEADLDLLDRDEPLESAIEITASPRGKRLGRLSLLSGGERALTAIALLFALHMVKPSPFCILDEVDAPLDDANVRRFVTMLDDLSHGTQFVIITHNKQTMQACGRLYGITMEEPGVSKVVSVELSASRDGVTSEAAIREAV